MAMMKKKLTKVGNSYGFRISKKEANQYHWKEGDTVEIVVYDPDSIEKKCAGWKEKYKRISFNVFCGLIGDTVHEYLISDENYKIWENLVEDYQSLYADAKNEFNTKKEELLNRLRKITYSVGKNDSVEITGLDIPGVGHFVNPSDEKKFHELYDLYSKTFADDVAHYSIVRKVSDNFRVKHNEVNSVIVDAVIRNGTEKHLERMLKRASWCSTLRAEEVKKDGNDDTEDTTED